MRNLYGIVLILFFSFALNGQSKTDVTVDENGILRWPDQTEVQGFGVNYTVPFAHAYRTAKKMGVDPKSAIDNDVYHFARLGFDAYRVHVWDTEISDSIGNLIVNEHLELFDYMLFKMKARGMKFLITPIAFWGNGWPEPDEETAGFSNQYGKADCLTNEEAIKAQENYLKQFLNHVNSYTGIAYKNDPDVIAFEVSNEPHHDESKEKVTTYVKRMVSAMKSSGCEKPILYNVSHSIHLMDAYYEAGIDGGTFQWYPTGLGSQEELAGNLLPNVDEYGIPFKNHQGFKAGAKIVYEFDAADVGRSYIYPAMARSFRTAGIQWATHFAYDPTFMAYANTEYNTHYMNLAYAPQKALSLKISSEVFHQVPLYRDYGNYPENATFNGFRVSYEEDLAEYVSQEKFYYTNHTDTPPVDADKLTEIAGYGNSSVVAYEGKGAYFLDKLDEGNWRLEVMPDAIWIDNLFGRNSLDKTVAVINWMSWPMSINLSDLGEEFFVKGINVGNDAEMRASKSSFDVLPGTYFISKTAKDLKRDPKADWKNIELNEFSAPSTTLEGIRVLHEPKAETSISTSFDIEATIVSKEAPVSMEVRVMSSQQTKIYAMNKVTGYDYQAVIPEEDMSAGYLNYFIVVREADQTYTFPAGSKSDPRDWDFYENETYTVNVVTDDQPLYLFDAASDFERLNMTWHQGVTLQPAVQPSLSVVSIDFDSIPHDQANSTPDYTIRHHFGKAIENRAIKNGDFKELIISGKATKNQPEWVELSLITESADIYGGRIRIEPKEGDYKIKLAALKQTQLVTLPRPYPGFLPYYFESQRQEKELDLSSIESVQISIGAGQVRNLTNQDFGLEIQNIRLE
ncbi:MAG: cellulase family glycosylhydrolase [Reichenbachiella sp.]